MDDESRLIAYETPHLRRFAVALTGHPEQADDLVQDAVERALRKRRGWRRTGNLRSWLFRILYRLYLNKRKRQRLENDRARTMEAEATATVAPDQEKRVEVLNIAAALDHLPAEQREAVLLVGLEGLSYDEAAYVMGVAVGTVKSRLYRGRETLSVVRDHEGSAQIRRVK